MGDAHQQALTYLKTDPLRHLVHLKYLHLYPDIIDCTVTRVSQSTGVLLSHLTRAVGWDARLYPTTKRVLLPVASDQPAAERLLALVLIGLDGPFVLKCAEKCTRAVFGTAFHLDFQRAYVSYTVVSTTQQVTVRRPDQDVIVSTTPDETLIRFFTLNGYTADEVRKDFSQGALSFTIYNGEEPVSACMAYRNFGRVWEIGGVYTLERARRRGYARRVVLAALSHLAGRGLTPRYQVEHTNLPSISLAESIGLEPCLYFEHYLCRISGKK